MRKKQKNTIMNNKGITLIALVITIVVLIILATIAINLTLGNNGIVNRAKLEVMKYNNASNEEKVQLLIAEWRTENYNSEISLIDFLNRELDGGRIDDIEQTEEGIEIYIGDSVTIVDSNGEITKTTERAKERPEIRYTLSSTDPNQDKVTITVKATIKEGNIANIVKPNGDSENADEIEFDVTKNGKYRFIANSSTGTNKKIIITITNVKISSPVISFTQIAGTKKISTNGVEVATETKAVITFEDNDLLLNYYSDDDGTTWQPYTGEITTTSNKIRAKSIVDGYESNYVEATKNVTSFGYALGENAYDTGTNKDSTAYYDSYADTCSYYIMIDPSLINKKIQVKQWCYGNSNYYGTMYLVNADNGTINSYSLNSNQTITIPENASGIRWDVYSVRTNGDSGEFRWRIYDISVVN